MEIKQLKNIVEALLLAAGRPVSLEELVRLFGKDDAPSRQDIRGALTELQGDYADRGLTLIEVASGFRIQVHTAMTPWLEKLWEERPPRYSRALMETLAIIAYRQPVTRGDIEDIRGVSVTTNIVRTLLERGWIRVVGHRDVPGKPAMFGTTKEFLDYFGLRKLDDLPPLAELKDFERLNVQLDFPEAEESFGAPGGPEPLVHGGFEAQPSPATVSSIEDARFVAESEGRAAPADNRPSTGAATVVPLKTT